MIKPDSASSEINQIVLLTYSTWLVAGVWLLYTGAEQLYNAPSAANSSFDYLFGTVRILIGVHTWRTALAAALDSNNPKSVFLRLITAFLFTLMIGMPVILFVFETSMTIFGTYQPGELSRKNVIRIISIAVCYLFATIFADWRLKKHTRK